MQRAGALLVGALHLFGTACYSYVPVRTGPAPGVHLAFELSDAGRTALARALGPGVIRLEGNLVAMQGEAYLLDATSVMQGPRMSLPVEGIRVTVDPAYAVRVDERRLSRKRTLALVGTAALAVAGFFFAADWFGKQTPPEGTPGGGPDEYRGTR